MRISFVIPYFYPAWQYGGQPRSAFELGRALVRRGHSVRVLTTDSGGPSRLANVRPIHQADVEGIDVIYYRNLSNYLAFRHHIFWPTRFFREVYDQVREQDILHIHELRSTLSVPAYNAARNSGIPYVISPHGGLRHLGKEAAKTVFDRVFGKRILNGAAAVLAASPFEESDARNFDVDASLIFRLPNAICPDDYSHLPSRQTFRARWHLGGKRLCCFWDGSTGLREQIC